VNFGSVLALLLLCACGVRGPESIDIPVDAASLPPDADFLAQIDRTRGFRDCFTPIRDPRLVPAADAPRMRGDERVLGLDLGLVRIAYPVLYLDHHEIVEHTAAGQDLLVCW
jgi:hypothetical protein